MRLAAAPWVHPLAVVVTVLIIVALIAGYAGLAAFVRTAGDRGRGGVRARSTCC